MDRHTQSMSTLRSNMTATEFRDGLQRLCEKTGVEMSIFEIDGLTTVNSPTGQIEGVIKTRRVPRKGDPTSETLETIAVIRFCPFGLNLGSRL